jgi:DNA-binding MarR family transcriptional regulator
MARKTKKPMLSDSDYRALADFRFHIRQYLDFSDRAARDAGIEPKQYQLLLAIRGMPEDVKRTVGELANQLRIRHHSAVELVNRAERNNLVERARTGTQVFVSLTYKGHKVLQQAVEERLHELRIVGPALVNTLRTLVRRKERRPAR